MGAFVRLPLSAFISEFEADISDGAASLGGPELPKFDFNHTVSFVLITTLENSVQ